MAAIDVDALVRRMDRSFTKKDLWKSHLEQAYRLAIPNRNLFAGVMGDPSSQPRGNKRMDQVYDGTLMRSTFKTANRLQSEITPPATKWADFVPGVFVPKEKQQELRKRLSTIRDAVFAAIHLSNFDSAIQEFFLDLMTGMGALMIIENQDPMDAPFSICVIPRAQIAVEEGVDGKLRATYRKHYLDPHLFAETYGLRFKKPAQFDQYLKDNEPGKKECELREAIFYDPKIRKWHYVVLWRGDAKGSSYAPIVQEVIDDTPMVVTRWQKVAGEVEGRGPVLTALPDALTANKVVEFVLKNAAFAVSGLWMARNDGVINPATIRIVPGAVIPVGATGGALGASIAPLEFGGRFDVAQLVLADLRLAIREAMLDKQLPEETGAVRSATEIIARLRELAQDIGSPFGRIMSEFVRPFLQKVLNLLAKKGIMSENGKPIRINGATVQVQVNSPLAREQDLADVETVVKWAAITRSIGGEMGAMVSIKVEDVGEYLAKKLGVDPNLVRDETQREEMQKKFGAMMGQQVAAGNVSPAQIANDAGGGGNQIKMAA